MANLGYTFDATQVEPNAPYEVMPAGDYVATIVSSEMRQNKAMNGEYLLLEMAIEDGPHKGRRLFDRLNLYHANPQVAEIAQKTLSAICHAVGKFQVQDSEELHHQRMIVRVNVRPAGPDKGGTMREASNEVKGYRPVGGANSAAASSPSPQQQQGFQRPNPQQASQTAVAPAQNASRPSTPPWRKQQ